MGMRATCCLETGRFFHKIWAREQWFLVKSREKNASYWLFRPIMNSSFNRIDVFLTNCGRDSRGFHKKFQKNDMRAICFWRMDMFLTKYGQESWMFLENGGFFMCSFNRIDIFWPNMGMTAGGFSWKNWKITWEQCVLREWTYFWQNMGIKAFF